MPNQIAPGLFPELPASVQLQNKHPEAHHHDPNAPARVLSPNRLQIELHPSNLESLLPEGHHARLVWRYVEQQNLEGLYDIIKARQGGAGRSAIAPEILFALWLYATIDDIGSSGNSSANHLADEMSKQMANVTLTHVPYKGSGPSVAALIAGEIQVLFSSTTAVLPHVRAGRVRAARLPPSPSVLTRQRTACCQNSRPATPTSAARWSPARRSSLPTSCARIRRSGRKWSRRPAHDPTDRRRHAMMTTRSTRRIHGSWVAATLATSDLTHLQQSS